jgi:uncharacterized protein
VYLAVVTMMNAYNILFWSSIFGFHRPVFIFVLSFVLAASLLIANVYERKIGGILGRVFCITTATWTGASFILFSLTLMVHFATIFVDITQSVACLLLGFWVVVVIGSIINAFIIRVERTEVKLKGLRKGFTAVCLSDLHLGAVRNSGFATRLTKKVNEVKPDVVFIVGDLSDDTGNFTKKTVEPFEKMKAPIFYVTGNHENYLGLEKLLPVMRTSKMKMLRDETVMFKGVQLIGFDYPFEGTGITLEEKLKKIRIKKGVPNILLYHAPTEFSAAQKRGVDVMISGHVHGGQIVPFNFLVRLAFKYTHGFHDINGMKVIISQGAGTWGPPMRLGTRSEMIVLRINPKK